MCCGCESSCLSGSHAAVVVLLLGAVLCSVCCLFVLFYLGLGLCWLLLHDLQGLRDASPCFLELLEFGKDENGEKTNSAIHEIFELFGRGDTNIVSAGHVNESLDDPGNSHHGKSGNVATVKK